jgi:hypothetical protein
MSLEPITLSQLYAAKGFTMATFQVHGLPVSLHSATLK